MSLSSKLKQIPEINNRNIRLYYLFSFIHNAFFTEGNWIFLFLIYFNYQQLGILDAAAMGLGLILEIPTGALADLIGRKKTIQISFLLISIALSMIAFGQSQLMLFLGNMLLFIGLPMYSGAGDALAFDTMVESHKEIQYTSMFSCARIIQLIAFIFAVIIGGLVVTINPRLPFILWGLTFLVGLAYSFQLYEPNVKKIIFSWKNYWRQNVIGFKELFKPALKPYFAFIIILLGMDYMYGWGFLKPVILLSFNFSAIDMSLIFAATGLIGLLLLRWLPQSRKKISDYRGIVIATVGYAICFLAFSSSLQWVGLIAALFITIFGIYGSTLITIIVNEHALSEYRATTLSTVAMILKIPQVLIATIAGTIVQNGQLKPALFIFAIFIIIVSIITTSRYYKLFLKSSPEHDRN